LVELTGCHSVEGIQDFRGGSEEEGEERVLSVCEDGDEDEEVTKVADYVWDEEEHVIGF
jgi:hypothetical protein